MFEVTKGKSEAVNRRMTDNSMAKRTRTNNDLQNIIHQLTDRATSLKPRMNLADPGRLAVI